MSDARPGRADWSQSRRDAQQSGRSPWRFYNDDGAYTPVNFAVGTLGDAPFNDVTPPLLLYNRQLIAVSGGSSVKIMDADGAVLRTIGLDVTPKFIGISQQGWLYATAANKIVMQPPHGRLYFAIDISEKETVLYPPTIGAGGNLFVVTNKYVSAYPAPPVPTTLANLPLWRYRTTSGDKSNNGVSAVTLSEDEQTAYFVDAQSNAMIALDTATGAVKWKLEGVQISRAENEPMPVPVVAGGTLFVTNHAPTGSQLYVVNAVTGDLLRTNSGKDITAPVVGPDQSVYYFRDGDREGLPDREGVLYRLKLEKGKVEEAIANDSCPDIKKSPDEEGVNLLRADQSGNIYALDRNKNVLALVPAGGGKCVRLGGTPPGSYSASCSDISMNGTILTAQCRTTGGQMQLTALNVAQCVGDIGNHDGNLGCQGGQPASPQPPSQLNIASLIIAPDGSMFGYSRAQKLVRISPVAPGTLTLTNQILKLSKDENTPALVEDNDMTFRAGEVTTAPGLNLPANTNINIVAAKGVVFQPGLRIAAGARLRIKVGN